MTRPFQHATARNATVGNSAQNRYLNFNCCQANLDYQKDVVKVQEKNTGMTGILCVILTIVCIDKHLLEQALLITCGLQDAQALVDKLKERTQQR